MTALAILCYAILLLMPVLTLLNGLRCLKSISKPGAKEGFHADYAPSTPEAWSYIQTLAGKNYIIFSIIMLVCGLGFMLLMPYADTVSLLCCAGIALGIEIVVLLIGMTCIGMALQNHFKTSAV